MGFPKLPDGVQSTQAGPGGPAVLIVSGRFPARHVKGRCGTPLCSVSSLAFGAPVTCLSDTATNVEILEHFQLSCAIRARSTGK